MLALVLYGCEDIERSGKIVGKVVERAKKGILSENGDIYKNVYRKEQNVETLTFQQYGSNGMKYANDGEYNKALLQINRALEIKDTATPKEIYILYVLRGGIYHKMKDYTTALVEYNIAESYYDKHVDLYLYRGTTYYRMDDHINDIKDFEKVHNMIKQGHKVDDEQVLGKMILQHGMSLLLNKEFDRALEILETGRNSRYKGISGGAYWMTGLIHSKIGTKLTACVNYKISCQKGEELGCEESSKECQ